MTESCENCKFYYKERLRPGFGECRAHCPTLAFLPGQQGMQQLGAWPPTRETNWCGEHKPKSNGHDLEK